MTIDECLEMAGRYLKLADNQGAMTDKRAEYAAIAQAAAMTAGALVQASWWDERQEDAERMESTSHVR